MEPDADSTNGRDVLRLSRSALVGSLCSGKEICVTTGWLRMFREFQPDAVVHPGECPSAPY